MADGAPLREGRDSCLLLEHNAAPVLSASGLKQSYGQQSCYVKVHTLTQQSCSLRTLELELLTFLTKTPFLLLLALWSHGALGG